jgi:COMPASS component BRE2
MTTSQSPAPALEAVRLLQENAPAVSSPLNPEVRGRGQRERKETAKKREATRGTTPTVPAKRKTTGAASATTNGHVAPPQTAPSPMRYQIPPPKTCDYEAPKPPVFTSHEPSALVTPDGKTELQKVTDQAENKRGYRYTLAVADPNFRHKQYYRQSDGLPYGARMSFEDADRFILYDSTGHFVSNQKGWRMARANVCAREGSLYYEVRIVRGLPVTDSPESPQGPEPHVRFGWARREAPLDSPIGFDGYSYGITDSHLEPMHRSRPSKFFQPKTSKHKTNTPIQVDDRVREGDIIGLEITLPSLSLHQKVVTGQYNPAVDLGDGFEDQPPRPDPTQEPHHIIRDRIPVPYKGNVYFETMDYVSTKPVEVYADRTLSLKSLSIPAPNAPSYIKAPPNPHHPDVPLRTLPHSHMRVYKNGKLVGTAFENLLSFLPPASQPSKLQGAREGFDDGTLGYFPAISCFTGGIAQLNFGDGPHGFWMPPAHLTPTTTTTTTTTSDTNPRYYPGRNLRPIAERFKEQIAEDVLWDIIDEVDFFIQDGGFGGKVGAGGASTMAKTGVFNASLKEEVE